MENFLHRCVTVRGKAPTIEGDEIQMEVSRTRTSSGFAAIRATFGEQTIEFANDQYYEQSARYFAEMLLQVCAEPCTLPSDEPVKGLAK